MTFGSGSGSIGEGDLSKEADAVVKYLTSETRLNVLFGRFARVKTKVFPGVEYVPGKVKPLFFKGEYVSFPAGGSGIRSFGTVKEIGTVFVKGGSYPGDVITIGGKETSMQHFLQQMNKQVSGFLMSSNAEASLSLRQMEIPVVAGVVSVGISHGVSRVFRLKPGMVDVPTVSSVIGDIRLRKPS